MLNPSRRALDPCREQLRNVVLFIPFLSSDIFYVCSTDSIQHQCFLSFNSYNEPRDTAIMVATADDLLFPGQEQSSRHSSRVAATILRPENDVYGTTYPQIQINEPLREDLETTISADNAIQDHITETASLKFADELVAGLSSTYAGEQLEEDDRSQSLEDVLDIPQHLYVFRIAGKPFYLVRAPQDEQDVRNLLETHPLLPGTKMTTYGIQTSSGVYDAKVCGIPNVLDQTGFDLWLKCSNGENEPEECTYVDLSLEGSGTGASSTAGYS